MPPIPINEYILVSDADRNYIDIRNTNIFDILYRYETEIEAPLEIKNEILRLEFKKNITTNATQVDFIDANGNVITNTEELVKTGMEVKFNNTTEYTIIVRGDLNGDGNISLVDFSKLIAHISERPEFILSGNTAMAADLSGDGKISLLDLSQFLVIFSAI